MMARLFLYSDEGAWIRAQTDAMIGAVEEALRRGREGIHICLSGGRTPEPVYKALAADPVLNDLARRINLHFWVGDERDLPPGHEDRNDTMIRRTLGKILGLVRFHGWPSGDRASACRDYGESLRSQIGPDPTFDFTLLGMGSDGHTAGVFDVSDAASPDRPFTHPSQSPLYPKSRMTVSANVLRRSAILVVGLRGKAKKAALDTALAGSPSPIGLIAGKAGIFHYLKIEEQP